VIYKGFWFFYLSVKLRKEGLTQKRLKIGQKEGIKEEKVVFEPFVPKKGFKRIDSGL